MPETFDVAADETAQKLLKQWLRQPWDGTIASALCDRLEELGMNTVAFRQEANVIAEVQPAGRRRKRALWRHARLLWKALTCPLEYDLVDGYDPDEGLPF